MHTGKRLKTLLNIIKNFTPAWFSAIMGTGVVDILFYNFPYGTNTLTIKIFTFIFFFINLSILFTSTALSIARYVLFPDIWSKMMRHPVQNLYLGCYPMGLTTIINIAVGLLVEDYHFGGNAFLYFLWGVWWLDVIMASLCCWPGMHYVFTRQTHTLNDSTGVWLLPVVTLIVGASSGGILATALLKVSPYHALITVTVTAVMVTVGLSLAMMLTTVYFARLIVHGVPKGAIATSVWINLGPAGQAGYAILQIGSIYKVLLPLHYGSSPVLTSSTTGETIDVICVFIAVVLWAFGTMWVVYSVLAMLEVKRSPFGFSVTLWGIIFPNGVYANLTIQLYRTFDSKFFRIFGTLYAVWTMLLWAVIAGATLWHLRDLRVLLMDSGLGLVDWDPQTKSGGAVRQLGRDDREEERCEDGSGESPGQRSLGWAEPISRRGMNEKV